jgi:hypothetical protein
MTRSPRRPSKLRLLHEVKVQLQETLTVYCPWASLARHSSKLQPFHSHDERLSPSVVLSGHNSQQMCNASGGIIRLGHRLSCLPFGEMLLHQSAAEECSLQLCSWANRGPGDRGTYDGEEKLDGLVCRCCGYKYDIETWLNQPREQFEASRPQDIIRHLSPTKLASINTRRQ